MKIDELKKWKEATEEEIDRKIDELEKQRFNMLAQIKIGQLKDYSVLKKLKKDIAVLKTVKNEKKRKGK